MVKPVSSDSTRWPTAATLAYDPGGQEVPAMTDSVVQVFNNANREPKEI